MSEIDLPRRMFKEGEKPKGQKINLYQQVYLIKELLEVFDEAEVSKLRESGFSGLFEIPMKPYFSRAFILMLLSRLLEVEKRKELWFVFAGMPIRVSLREFSIVTGLRCGKYPPLVKAKTKNTIGVAHPYYGTLFGLETQVSCERVVEILRARRVTDPQMRLRYAALVIIDGILLATSGRRMINPKHAEMSRDLGKFLEYPWGRKSYEAMVDSIKQRKPWQLALQAVTVHGFTHAIQLVVIAAVPSIQIEQKQTRESEDEDEEELVEKGSRKEAATDEKCGTPFLLKNARKIDRNYKKFPIEVEAIIEPDHEFIYPDEDLTWDEEISDRKVANLVKLINEKKVRAGMLRGGRIIADIRKPAKQPANKEGDKDRSGKGKRKCRGTSSARRGYDNESVESEEKEPNLAGHDFDVSEYVNRKLDEVSNRLYKKLKKDLGVLIKTSQTTIVNKVLECIHKKSVGDGKDTDETESKSGESNDADESDDGSQRFADHDGADDPPDIDGSAGTVHSEGAADFPSPPSRDINSGNAGGGPLGTITTSDTDQGSPITLFQSAVLIGMEHEPQQTNVEPVDGSTKGLGNKSSDKEPQVKANTKSQTEMVSISKASKPSSAKQVKFGPTTTAPGTVVFSGEPPGPEYGTSKPNREIKRTFIRKSESKRIMTTNIDDNFICSTATKNLIGHPKNLKVLDDGEKAIVEHFELQLRRLLKHSYFTIDDNSKITYRDIKEVFVNGKAITSKLVEKISLFAIMNPATGLGGGQNKITEFLRVEFISGLMKLCQKFDTCKKKEDFLFPRSVEREFASADGSGLFPSFVTATDIYSPYQLGKKHWVMLCFNQETRTLNVLDCNKKLFTDKEIEKELRGPAAMLPYLIKQADMRGLTSQDVTPYRIRRSPAVPQISSHGDPGIVSLVALRYDAAGLLERIEKLEHPTLILQGKLLVADFIADSIDFVEG